MKKCAMMDCDVNDDTPTLKELLSNECEYTRGLAERYIKNHGFKETDIICEDCWGK